MLLFLILRFMTNMNIIYFKNVSTSGHYFLPLKHCKVHRINIKAHCHLHNLKNRLISLCSDEH